LCIFILKAGEPEPRYFNAAQPELRSRSRSRKDPHLFGGAGAATRCGSAPVPAPTAPAPNMMFYISGLLQILQSVTVFTFFVHICKHLNHTKIKGKSSLNPWGNFGLFSKSWLRIL
jgi:hypothetical protein